MRDFIDCPRDTKRMCRKSFQRLGAPLDIDPLRFDVIFPQVFEDESQRSHLSPGMYPIRQHDVLELLRWVAEKKRSHLKRRPHTH